MPEGMNVEIAHKLTEHETGPVHHKRWHGLLEIVEVVVLALVAITTAWTGLQAAKWDSHASLLYGQASTARFQADAASTLAGLQLSADASMFTGWLQARATGDHELQAIYVRRFTPDYRDAYEAWLKTVVAAMPAWRSAIAATGPAMPATEHQSVASHDCYLGSQHVDVRLPLRDRRHIVGTGQTRHRGITAVPAAPASTRGDDHPGIS